MDSRSTRHHTARQALYLGLVMALVLGLLPLGVGLAQGTAIIDTGFDSGSDGFSYEDNTFRGTSAGSYASGSYEGSGGRSGGGLRVYLGAIDSVNPGGMSGGWVEGFTLSAPAEITVSFWYNLSMASEYESDEYGEVLVSLDGTLYGTGSNDYVAHMAGNGNGGSVETTGWQQFSFSATLGAGSHDLAIGGYNNKKTYSNEWTEVVVDDVLVTTTGSVPPSADAGPDQSVLDADENGVESVTLDGSGSSDLDGTIVSYEWSEGGGALAAGASPTVDLGVGTHTIVLTVTDDDSETDTDEVVVQVKAPAAAQAIVDRLDLATFKANIKALNDFGDRCQMTGCSLTSYNNAQAWLEGELAAMGYAVQRHYYYYNSTQRASTYVTKVGANPDQMYMVACHLDGRGGGGAADDNGSGCSLVMELARVLAQPDVETDVSVRMFWWGNEETGLNGSTAYRNDRYNQADEPEWLGNITHDMVLYDHGVPAQPTQNPNADIDVEYRRDTTYETQSHALADAVAAAAGSYSPDYPAQVNDYSTNTDDTPYHNYCPSISVRENRRLNEISGVHPYYHTSGDVYENYSELDFLLGFNAVQMTTGAVAELAGARIVSSNNAPVADAQAVSTDEDVALGITLTGSDADSDPLTFSVSAGPSNGTLSGIAPNLTYTPNGDWNGADSFTFRAYDGQDYSAVAVVDIDVVAVNDAPLAEAQNVSTDEDVALAITLSGTDVDGDALSYALGTGPTNGTLSGTAPNLSYTPDADWSGSDSFTFLVNDGSLDSAEATVSIDVGAVNDAPVADAQAVSTGEDTALPITLTASDVENDTLTFLVSDHPDHGSLSGSVPTLTYTPDEDYHGPDSFSFIANDGALDSAVAIVHITIDPVNDAPVADAQSVDVVEDTAKAITLTGSDVDGDGLSYVVTVDPGHGDLTGTAPNLTYTPDLNYVGADNFSFKVNDGTVDSPDAVVSIDVTEFNSIPVADDQAVSTDEDEGTDITLTGSDADGDPIAYAVVDPPLHGTLEGAAPALTYTPDLDYSGPDSFTFIANDGKADSPPGTVSIAVEPINDAPVATGQSVATDEDVALDITLVAADADGDPLTYNIVDGPHYGSLGGSGANRTYIPGPDFNGLDSFDFVANDGQVNSARGMVRITVHSVNDAPLAVDDHASTPQEAPLSGVDVLANDSDADGDGLDVVSVTQPANGIAVLNPNDTVGYTPGGAYCGVDTFTYDIVDGEGGSATGTVYVDVVCDNDPPIAEDSSATTTDGNPVDITLVATDPENDTLTYSVIDYPDHGSLSGTPPDLSYTADPGYTGPDSFTFVANDGEYDSNLATVSIAVEPFWPALETGTASGVGSAGWTTVTLARSYTSMVVVASANYDGSTPAAVVRIQNAAGSSFDLRVDPAGGSAVGGVPVNYIVVEEGVYDVAGHGVKMEAVRYTSTRTDHKESWAGESRGYQQSYANPVVVGQVMTYNDADWSVFWASDGNRKNAPSSSGLNVGKHVGEDPDATRADETIGYIVIEAGNGSIGGTGYVAAVGSDGIRGMDNNPPYAYSYSGLSSVSAAVVSAAGMDGGNGGWPVLFGAAPATTTRITLGIDEDQANDAERKHTTEQVAYIVFE